MTSYVTPKKNTAFVFSVGLPSQANGAIFQADPTLAAGDVKVAIDNGALTNLTTLPTVTPASGKLVKVSLSAAEMNGDNIQLVFSDATGAEWSDVVVNIQTTVQQIDDLATAAALTVIDDFLDTEVAAILAAVDTEVAAIKAKTDNLPADPADASDLAALINGLPTAAENATQLLDVAAGVETGLTVRQYLRLAAAVLFGKASGLSGTTAVYRDTSDTRDRIVSTVDADGNRTEVLRDSA